VISLAELARRLSEGVSLAGAVVLTFDDGYEDNLTEAFPILKQYNFPATIFVVTDLVNASDERGLRHLSAAQMIEMQDSGLITLAPHSKSHKRLTLLSAVEAKDEIEGSQKALQAITGEHSPFFAYPYGGCDARIRGSVASLGFTLALGTQGGTLGKRSDRFRLPRNEVNASTDLAKFRRMHSRAADVDGRYREARKRISRFKAKVKKALSL
jgi:peptidoglycan/xylan/chitin deacetylase (PgdA/CDA1 family)